MESAFLAKIATRLKSIQRYLPWVSFLWGVTSTFLIGRDYSQASRVLVYTAGSIGVLLVLNFWFEFSSSLRAQQGRAGIFESVVAKNKDLVEWVGLTTAQIGVQFILLYVVPLMYLSHSYFVLLVTILCAATTLWDPWWFHLIKVRPYRIFIRFWTVICAASFLFAVFFSEVIGAYSVFIGCLGVLACLPFIVARDSPIKNKRYHLIPFALSVVFLMFQLFLPPRYRFPLLAVWTQDAAFGFGVRDHDLAEPLSGVFSKEELKKRLASGTALCCQTPIVGPGGLEKPLIHEWKVNGATVDSIELPPVTGTASTALAYRTRSCKSNFGDIEKIEKIECIAYIEPNIYIGRTVLESE